MLHWRHPSPLPLPPPSLSTFASCASALGVGVRARRRRHRLRRRSTCAGPPWQGCSGRALQRVRGPPPPLTPRASLLRRRRGARKGGVACWAQATGSGGQPSTLCSPPLLGAQGRAVAFSRWGRRPCRGPWPLAAPRARRPCPRRSWRTSTAPWQQPGAPGCRREGPAMTPTARLPPALAPTSAPRASPTAPFDSRAAGHSPPRMYQKHYSTSISCCAMRALARQPRKWRCHALPRQRAHLKVL